MYIVDAMQQKDLRQYDVAIKTVATMFADLKAIGISLQMVNLGGGFPTRYRKDIPSIGMLISHNHQPIQT